MGVVYRARDSRLSRDVALKMLHRAADKDPDQLRRFLEEARAAAALNHPNIVAVHDIAIDADTPYIIAELIDGGSLRQELDRGALKPARLLDLATQIADGLTAAHRAGLVHRDLKPENVMISRDGRAKIVDFGLAKPLGLNQEGIHTRTLTAPHTIVGTPACMSPEQARGSPVDFRSDLFSFGAMLYEMVSRQRAFDRQSSIDTLSAILHEDPRPLLQLNDRCPPELQRIVERCLSKSPDDRYAATADLLHDLRWMRDCPNPPASADIAANRSRGWLVMVVAAIGIAAAAFVGGWATSPRLREDSSGAQPPKWRRLDLRERQRALRSFCS